MNNIEEQETHNISQKVEELTQVFEKYKNSQNKKEIIRGLIEDKYAPFDNIFSDIFLYLKMILQRGNTELIIYIFDNYSFEISPDEVTIKINFS
jgi:hypothetical protein